MLCVLLPALRTRAPPALSLTPARPPTRSPTKQPLTRRPTPSLPSSQTSSNRAQKAEAQLDAAIAYKASFLDGYLGKSALAQLRAKIAADYLVTPVK